jgi:hypothetical protein
MARNPDKRRCAAHSKQTGLPCGRWAAPGFTVCHYHGAGGGRPKGIPRSPNTPLPPPPPKGNTRAVKHGAYSKRLLPEEQDRYHEFRERLLADFGGQAGLPPVGRQLVHEVALASAKLGSMMARGAGGRALADWDRRLRSALKALKEAQRSTGSRRSFSP